MSNRRRKSLGLLAWIIALSMFLIACSGGTDGTGSDSTTGTGTDSNGTGGTGEVAPAGQFPIVDELIEMDVWIESNADTTDWSTNEYLRVEVEERTNVKLNIIEAAGSADALDRRNILLASGDYPDMFLADWNSMFTQADVLQFGVKEGILVPINDYIEPYSVELKRLYDYNSMWQPTTTAPDGNIYGVARFSECFHCTAYPKMFFNTEWLEALGLDYPSDTDELYETLKAFKEQDPNGNGEADEVPLTGAISWNCPVEYAIIGYSFLPLRPNFWLYLEDGEMKFAPVQEAYRDGLEYMNMLYSEGLIDPGAFTQRDDVMKQLILSEPTKVGAYVADHMGMGADANYPELYRAYESIPAPFKGPNGVQIQPSNSGESEISGFHGVITDKCEYPEAAFRLLDMFLEEEQTVKKAWGKEGLGWEYAPAGTENVFGGEAKWIQKFIPEENFDDVEENDRWIFFAGPQADITETRSAQMPMPEDIYDGSAYEARITMQTIPLVDYHYPETLPSTYYVDMDVADEYIEIQTNLNEFIKKSLVEFVIGERDIENDWATYISELESFGWERYLEIYNQAYQNAN